MIVALVVGLGIGTLLGIEVESNYRQIVQRRRYRQGKVAIPTELTELQEAAYAKAHGGRLPDGRWQSDVDFDRKVAVPLPPSEVGRPPTDFDG